MVRGPVGSNWSNWLKAGPGYLYIYIAMCCLYVLDKPRVDYALALGPNWEHLVQLA